MKGLRRTLTIREGFYDDRGKSAETSIIALFVNFVSACCLIIPSTLAIELCLAEWHSLVDRGQVIGYLS